MTPGEDQALLQGAYSGGSDGDAFGGAVENTVDSIVTLRDEENKKKVLLRSLSNFCDEKNSTLLSANEVS